MSSANWSDYSRVTRLSAANLISIDVVEFFLLIFLLLCRAYHWLWIDRLPAVIGGIMPLMVPWAGALGGLSISIVGVSRNFRKWGPKINPSQPARDHEGYEQRLEWNAWHLTRPLVGAVFGTFAVLIVVFVLGTIGLTDDGSIDITPAGAATLMVIAFLIGYRERTFRLLIERVVDTIFGPGSDPESASYDLLPAELDFEDVALNSSKSLKVSIRNNGQRLLRMAAVTVNGPGFTKASRIGNLAAGDSDEIDIRFSPTQAGAASGTLIVRAGGIEKTVNLKGRGV
jgi:Abnormal spindle-like microcephaly-assoc'd, ASPM-SPD-2-Hydin